MHEQRPITFQMANTLHHVITTQGRGTAYVERDVDVLVRRKLLWRVEGDRRLRITQLGRETLAQHYWSQNNDTQQPNVIVRCYFWSDFYGTHAELRYRDDPDHPVRLDWAQEFDDHYKALQFVLRNLTAAHHLLLACCPENHNPDLE